MTSKRIFDIFFSSLGLIVLSPAIFVIAILIKASSPGPIIFRQRRSGKNGRIFEIYKFRTMIKDADKKGINFTTPKRDTRITKIGRTLRRFYLDEIPQLFNVIKGDMSIVGPRPEVPEIVALYSEKQKKVLSVRPGITDLATLNFLREGEIMDTSQDLYHDYTMKVMPEKLDLNLEYIQKQSLLFDIGLILKTISKIIFR